jgi:starch phosphorylase
MTKPANTKTRSTRPGGREPTRTGRGAEALRQAYLDNLFYVLGRFADIAGPHDRYQALAYTARDRVLQRAMRTQQAYKDSHARTVAYLSAEFLLGPHLGNALLSLGITEDAREALAGLGLSLEELIAEEEEPGLGNGGLGRLAACFMDSLATLGIPAIGYGIRYEFGIFDQTIRDGWQAELTDRWLRWGNPWELPRPRINFLVNLGGHTEPDTDEQGRFRVRWVPGRQVRGVAYDTMIPGDGVGNANLLRLWSAEAPESFRFEAFNLGDYYGAVEENVFSENLTKVLYPNDEPAAGKRLRLEQQYFFVSCSLQDMIRIHLRVGSSLESFHEKWAVQLNDTHPAIGVAELMRLLIDEHALPWDQAWGITTRTFAYTNHTLLPEALERWPVPLFESVLPRHLEIIYEINRRFLDEVRLRYPDDGERLARLSLIDESGERYVRMAHLATVGGHAVNGVAALHSELLKQTVMRDFHELSPEKFHNVTNGVTPRRFVRLANPPLAALLDRVVGNGWTRDMGLLKGLEPLADDPGFQGDWRQVKRAAKEALAARIARDCGCSVDLDSIFDVQVKRIHEYKRQHLNVLHLVSLYLRLKQDPNADLTPRTAIFGGKAAPGLLHGQAHHQAHPLGGRGGQCRPGARWPAAGRLPARLQRQERAADLPGGGPLRADLDRRARGIGHRQHEVHHERGAHHRHPRRGQRRDPRRGRARALLPLRPHRRGGPAHQGRGLPALGDLPAQPAPQGDARPDRLRPLLPRRPRALPAAGRRPARARPLSLARRLRGLPRGPGRGGARLPRPRPLDAHVDREYRALRSLLLRPVDRRLRRADLEGPADAGV